MSPGKFLIIIGKVKREFTVCFPHQWTSFLLPTYIYHSTSLPEMLSFECDPLKNTRELYPFGHWYLGIRKVKYSPFKKHTKKLNRVSVTYCKLEHPRFKWTSNFFLQSIKFVVGEFCAFLIFNFWLFLHLYFLTYL